MGKTVVKVRDIIESINSTSFDDGSVSSKQ